MNALHLSPQVGVPMPSPIEWLFIAAAPFLIVAGFIGLSLGTKVVMRRFFPLWEWQQSLGWLNIRAHKRAEAVMRWLGYLFKACVAVALYGIVWAAPALSSVDNWKEPNDVADNMAKLTVLIWCSALWAGYFYFELVPKLKAEFEWEDLQEFRGMLRKREEELERKYPSLKERAKAKWQVQTSRVGRR
jgi:hypothetical protein